VTDFTNLPKDCLKVLQFTDTHLYKDLQGNLLGMNTYESFRLCIEKAYNRHWPADLVLATGDLTHDATPEAYQHLKNIFQTIECDICPIAGNHDNTDVLSRILPGENIIKEKYYTRRNWLIVLLDSSIRNSEAGKLAESELRHLEDCLEKHPDHYVMICLHHPPVTINSKWIDTMMLQNPQEFFNILNKHENIKIILWGHIHQEFKSTINDITLLASPSTCVQFLPLSDDFAIDELPPGYRWLVLHDDGTFDTGIERLDEAPAGLDPKSNGY
jgi:Icc protein